MVVGLNGTSERINRIRRSILLIFVPLVWYLVMKIVWSFMMKSIALRKSLYYDWRS